MNPGAKDDQKITNHEEFLQQFCLHCLPNGKELQAKISKQGKEIAELKEEKEEWLGDQRRYIVKLGDYYDEKNELKLKLKEMEEEKNHLMTKLKKNLDDKSNVMKDLEIQSAMLGNSSEDRNKLNTELFKVEEEKNLLVLELKRVLEERNSLLKNLEGKSQTIHRFLNEQVKVIKYTDLKTMGKILRAFSVVRKNTDVFRAEQLIIKKKLDELQETCNNCRATFLKEKRDYETKIKSLENKHVNDTFLLEQQSILIFEQKQRERLRKEMTCHKKEKECSQQDQKLVKEKGEILSLLPPTPDSWSTSQDTTSSEDIGCGIKQRNITDNYPETRLDPLERTSGSKFQEDVAKSKNKQNKSSKKGRSLIDKGALNITQVDLYDNVKNPIETCKSGKVGRKNKILLESKSMGMDAIDDYGNSSVQELTNKSSTSHDKTSSEDIGCGKKQINVTDNCPKTRLDSLERTSQSRFQKDVSKSKNKQKKSSKKNLSLIDKGALNITQVDPYDNVKNPIETCKSGKTGRKKKILLESNSVGMDAIDDYGNSSVQELTNKNLCDKDNVPLEVKVAKPENGKSLSIKKVPQFLDSNDLSKQNISTVNKDVSPLNMNLSSTAEESIIKKGDSKKGAQWLQKLLKMPVNERATTTQLLQNDKENKVKLTDKSFKSCNKSLSIEPIELAGGNNKDYYQCLGDIDAKSIIGSEGWSPLHNLESNDFEPNLSKFAQYPEIVSPFRVDSVNDSRSGGNNSYVEGKGNCSKTSASNYNTSNNVDLYSGLPKQGKSIFSPIHFSNNQFETTVVSDKTTEDPIVISCKTGEHFIESKHQSGLDCDRPNTTYFIFDSKSKQNNDDVTNEIKTKSLGVCPLSPNYCAQRKSHFEEDHKTEISKISNDQIVNEKKEQPITVGNVEDDIKPLKINIVKDNSYLNKLNTNSIKETSSSIKDELKDVQSKTSKRFYDDNYLSLTKVKKDLRNPIKDQIVCSDDKLSFFSLPCFENCYEIPQVPENKNHVKMCKEENGPHIIEIKPPKKLNKHLKSVEEISEKNKTKQPEISSCPSVKNKTKGSPLTLFSPGTTSKILRTNADHCITSPHGKVKVKKTSKELRDSNTIHVLDNLFVSPQSKYVSSQHSLRSPTAMDCYGLQQSPKVPKNFQFSATSPVKKRPRFSTTLSNKSSTNKNVKNFSSLKATKRKGSESSCDTKSVCHLQNHKNRNHQNSPPQPCKTSSPRSPDSMKHYDMRLNIPKKKYKDCSSSSCLGVEANGLDVPQSTGVHETLRFKKSNVLPNVASNHAEILSEIKAQSSKDDSEPLEIKLRLTPQERIDNLKDQEGLAKPVKISIGYKRASDASVAENSPKLALVQDISAPVNSGNEGKPPKKVRCENNRIKISDPPTFHSTLNPFHRSYSQTVAHSSANDLLKIADKSSSESLATTVARMNISVKKYPQASTLRQQALQHPEYVSNTLTDNIEATPVHKMEVTVSEETLFMEYDTAYKIIGYGNCLFQGKRRFVNDGLNKKENLGKRLLTKEYLKSLNRNKISHINVGKITSLKKMKLTNKRKHFSRNHFRKRIEGNTNEMDNVTSSDAVDTRLDTSMKSMDKKVNESSILVIGSGGPCPQSKDNLKQEENLSDLDHKIETVKTINPVEYKSHNFSLPLNDDNYNSEEERDSLIIDIDESLMGLCEDDANSSIIEGQTFSCGPEFSMKITSERMSVVSNENILLQKTKEKQETDTKGLDIGNWGFYREKAETSNHLISSSNSPNFQPVPEGKYREAIEENVPKTKMDISFRENGVTPSSEAQNIPSTPVSTELYLPKFYTQLNDSKKGNPETSTLERVGQNKEVNPKTSTIKKNLPKNNVLKLKPLYELIPKGVKVSVTENVLRTVIKKHKEDLPSYKERNISEGRVPNEKVPGELVQQVADIFKPFLTEDLKSMTDVFKVVDKLEQYEIRVIVKAMMMTMFKLATEAMAGNSKAIWMLTWDVPQLPNKKSPIVHPKIQAASLLLYLVFDRFTKEKSDEDKKKFVEEELFFMERAFNGATSEFPDTLPVFWMNLGLLYTLLARQFGHLIRVRQLMYDMLYCFTKRALTVAYAMLIVWPSVLHARPIECYSNDPLALCLILQLTAVCPENNRTRSNHKTQSLQDLMWRKYKYRYNTVNADELFDLCVERLGQSGVHEALILLAKRQPRDWFKQRPFQKLMSVVEAWWKGGEECSDVRAVAAINALCSALRPYSPTLIQPELSKVFNLFKGMLSDENIPEWMQEVIIVNICRLARLNHNQCLDTIADWRPAEISQEVVDKILTEILGRRSPHWWATNSVGLFYLCRR